MEVQATKDGCPFCLEPLRSGATKCAACGSNVGDIRICPQCREAVRAEALTCPFCRADLRPPAPPRRRLLAEPWVIQASALGAFMTERSPTALFFPPIMTISEEEIRMHRRMLLGLRKYDQKIAVSRIASVRAATGPIWGTLIVETYGGPTGDLVMTGLVKEDAEAVAKLVEQLAHYGGSTPPGNAA